jgi:hypothetical protein
MTHRQLLVGFDKSTPEDTAIVGALDEWQEYLNRHPHEVARTFPVEIVHNPEHDAMDEYVVKVTWDDDGDQ